MKQRQTMSIYIRMIRNERKKLNVKIIVEISKTGINIFVTCTSGQMSRLYCNNVLQIVTEVK